jgi:hypothetical protein
MHRVTMRSGLAITQLGKVSEVTVTLALVATFKANSGGNTEHVIGTSEVLKPAFDSGVGSD